VLSCLPSTSTREQKIFHSIQSPPADAAPASCYLIRLRVRNLHPNPPAVPDQHRAAANRRPDPVQSGLRRRGKYARRRRLGPVGNAGANLPVRVNITMILEANGVSPASRISRTSRRVSAADAPKAATDSLESSKDLTRVPLKCESNARSPACTVQTPSAGRSPFNPNSVDVPSGHVI